ncbi:GtrA-like protein [Amycolatopsis marina]|uniref:GtrA-like protein n=1 Tax=Amycolatopsis marina TaxID=490629 RepID=A0A1I1C4Z2_9PSEU|nr:GtrA family protein [Amycolatopsis marina]SFB55563.1 GtrA-like protein [Amycolatopsis marina]
MSVPLLFARFCAAVVRRLPFGLAAVVAPEFLGFVLINTATFGVDLLLLTMLHGWWRLPIALAVTVAYVIAFGLSFLLNRSLNFRSHAPVGRQAALYAVAIAVNYAAFILGVGSGLVALGVQYHLARILAGGCEGLFMYSAMRWLVFRQPTPQPEPAASTRPLLTRPGGGRLHR